MENVFSLQTTFPYLQFTCLFSMRTFTAPLPPEAGQCHFMVVVFHSSARPPPTQCISLDIPAAAPSNINDNGELHVKNKSCIIAEEIHDIKNLALFLFDWNTQRKGTPQKCTRAILLPWFHWGLLPPALAFQPAAHGPTAIKGCGVQRKRKAFKVVFGVPALPSQQAADFLWD